MSLFSSLKAITRKQPESSDWVEPTLDQLSEEERTCLLLREQAGLSVAEIAEITGLGPERTRMTLYLARERMRSGLFEWEYGRKEHPVAGYIKEDKAPRSEIRRGSQMLPVLVILAVILLSPVIYDLSLNLPGILGGS